MINPIPAAGKGIRQDDSPRQLFHSDESRQNATVWRACVSDQSRDTGHPFLADPSPPVCAEPPVQRCAPVTPPLSSPAEFKEAGTTRERRWDQSACGSATWWLGYRADERIHCGGDQSRWAECHAAVTRSAGGEPVHRRHVGGWLPGEDGLAVVHGAEHVRLALNSFLVS
jgi:hypothetical protein